MNSGNEGRMSVLQFAIVGVVLAILLLGGVYFGTRQLHNAAQKSAPNNASKRASEEKKTEEQQKKEQDKKDQEAANKKAAEEKKQAEAKAAEDKKKQEQAAADAAQQQAQQNTTHPTPSAVASTGPEDTLFAVIGVAALSYAGYVFMQSRKKLANHSS